MKRVLAASVVCTALAILASCLGNIDAGGGGAPADPTEADGGDNSPDPQGGAGGEACIIPPSGFCSRPDDCACEACKFAAACTDGGCMANGWCDIEFEDTCVCSDCDADDFTFDCHEPCLDDGNCDRLHETCACRDCDAEPTCRDNVEVCSGGARDGACDPELESCTCSDCIGNVACTCAGTGLCYFDRSCLCNACWLDDFCSGLSCFEDGVCDASEEACHCSDCAGHELCAGY